MKEQKRKEQKRKDQKRTDLVPKMRELHAVKDFIYLII
jgi:hypothetical protein